MLKTIATAIVKEPRISAKQLCEYAEASALARNSILKSCKIKNPAVISISKRYNPAMSLICDVLSHSLEYGEVLEKYSRDLKTKSSKLFGRDRDNMVLCSEAVMRCYLMNEKLKEVFHGYHLENKLSFKGNKIKINGVDVSVRPELIISIDGGMTDVGFIKLCFCKNTPLEKSIGDGIASLGRLFFKKVKGIDFLPENCFVIDVFANRIFTAPKRDKRILDSLKACCLEIADRWDKIKID